MATKALLYSADGSSFEKTKENRCKSLVKQLLAVAIGERMYRYLVIRSAEEISQDVGPAKLHYTGKMPSHKTPGTKAKGPVVEQNGIGRARIVIANMIAAGR